MAKEEEPSKCQKLAHFVYNPHTGEIFGRTCINWVKITIFYCVFYSCLAGFWALMLYIFFTTVSNQKPKFILEHSRIGTSPGLGFRPRVPAELMKDSTLIWFNATKNETTYHWIHNLNEYLEPQKFSLLEKKKKACIDDDKLMAENGEYVCGLPLLLQEGPCSAVNGYGYPEGKPCVLIKINKVYGWKPVDYEKPPEELVKKLGEGVYQKGTVYITCHGVEPSDRENMGKLSYVPHQALNASGFPFKNQKNYLTPYIFVHFEKITKHVLVTMECRAWAKNIVYDRATMTGSVRFEIMVD